MSIIIGGSGSTGSTLLAAVLNRHQDILAGPELSLFNKEQLFKNWNKYKSRLLKGNKFLPFATEGWFPYPGTNLLHKEYFWNFKDLEKIISKTSTIKEFADCFFERPMKNHHAKIWVEQTPSNAYSFPHFLDHFQDGRVIHIARNPLDTVTSLVKRNFYPIFAAGMWVYNTTSALRVEKSSNYFLLKYEKFVQDPKKYITAVLSYIKAKPDFTVLNTTEESSRKSFYNPSWQNRPDDEISNKSIGSFYKLDEKTQSEIITSLTVFEISKKYILLKNLGQKNCQEVCEELKYAFEPNIDYYFKKKIERDFRRIFLMRTVKLYPTGGYNFPAKLNWNM